MIIGLVCIKLLINKECSRAYTMSSVGKNDKCVQELNHFLYRNLWYANMAARSLEHVYVQFFNTLAIICSIRVTGTSCIISAVTTSSSHV